jgi:hypothetical protein
MTIRRSFDRLVPFVLGSALVATALLLAPAALTAQSHLGGDLHEPHLFAAADFGIDPTAVTFTRDIAPIIERSCLGCHNRGGAAPMAFTSYQEVRR